MIGKRTTKALSAAGVVAAAILAVNLNVLVARRYVRWDLTSDALYSLSEATKRTLHSLSDPIDVIVLLSRSDPLTAGVRHLLTAYGAETQKLNVRFLDPDRNPAEFAALQQKYNILTGKAEDGRLVTDASIVIARGERRWFVTPDDMLRFDAESGRSRPRLEQALTEGIVNVLSTDEPLVCFSHGHQELGWNDAGPTGLAELRNLIEKSNYAVAERELPIVSATELDACRLLVVANPRVPFGNAEAQTLAGAIRRGMSALLLLGPIVGEGGALVANGLEPVLELAGASLGRDLVIENDPDARLPRAAGEVFFASPSQHAVTEGLLRGGGKLEFRILVEQAQSVRPANDNTRALFGTSPRAVALASVRPLLEGSVAEATRDAAEAQRVLAVARELPKPAGTDTRAARLVVSGAGNLAGSRNFRDAALYGNRLFVENAISWLAARPMLVSVPEKAEHEVGLALTEESLGEVFRYVIVYMPLSAALLGGFVLLRRRGIERRSRRDATKAKDEARA